MNDRVARLYHCEETIVKSSIKKFQFKLEQLLSHWSRFNLFVDRVIAVEASNEGTWQSASLSDIASQMQRLLEHIQSGTESFSGTRGELQTPYVYPKLQQECSQWVHHLLPVSIERASLHSIRLAAKKHILACQLKYLETHWQSLISCDAAAMPPVKYCESLEFHDHTHEDKAQQELARLDAGLATVPCLQAETAAFCAFYVLRNRDLQQKVACVQRVHDALTKVVDRLSTELNLYRTMQELCEQVRDCAAPAARALLLLADLPCLASGSEGELDPRATTDTQYEQCQEALRLTKKFRTLFLRHLDMCHDVRQRGEHLSQLVHEFLFTCSPDLEEVAVPRIRFFDAALETQLERLEDHVKQMEETRSRLMLTNIM